MLTYCASTSLTLRIGKRKPFCSMGGNPVHSETFPLSAKSVILSPALKMTPKSTSDPDFYPSLSRDFSGFVGHSLVSEHSFSEAWSVWELHPKGDELLYLLEGDVDFVLLPAPGKEHIVRLNAPGQTAIVPRGVWHTAKPRTHTRMLFVTPGEGTRNEAQPSFD